MDVAKAAGRGCRGPAARPGALAEAALEHLITKAEELDMDEVRASQ